MGYSSGSGLVTSINGRPRILGLRGSQPRRVVWPYPPTADPISLSEVVQVLQSAGATAGYRADPSDATPST